MTTRNLLHKSKLSQFKDWLSQNGHEWRDGKGIYQAIQIKCPSGWVPIHSRDGCEHFTVPVEHKRIVREFIDHNKPA